MGNAAGGKEQGQQLEVFVAGETLGSLHSSSTMGMNNALQAISNAACSRAFIR